MLAAVVAASAVPRAVGGLIVPAYSSYPGPAASPTHSKLYLDFDGEVSNDWSGKVPGITPAYDIDSDPLNFSPAELANIERIWQSVAEKYSPLKINVTTVDPGSVNNYETVKVVIGGKGEWSGGPDHGGIGILGSYMDVSKPNVAYVFPRNLRNGEPKFVAEAAAHEAGHAYGLKHQSTFDGGGNLVNEYNPGTAEKAPIMGVSYYAARGTWWFGHHSGGGGTFKQNDLDLLAASGTLRPNIGYRTDDHPSTLAAAEALSLSPAFDISAAGVIERVTDADYFSFTSPGGTAHLYADVAPFGAMLDVTLKLYDANDTLLATAASASLGESLKYALEPGTYKIGVFGAGLTGDVGQYFLSGSAVPEPACATALLPLAAWAIARRTKR